MNKAIKKKWLRALRSGKYKQTRKALARQLSATQRSYCCLGVLCQLHADQVGKDGFAEHDGKELQYLGSPGLISDKVRAWAGLETRDPKVNRKTNGGYDQCLSGLNDSCKMNFKEIADVIAKDL